jgi:HK97 family phage prohead protease
MTETLFREVDVSFRAEGDGRTLVSRLVPYNQVAIVSDGGAPYSEMFLPGAFRAQMRAANRIRAFLNFRHRQGLQDQIGYAKSIRDDEDGLHGELRVLNTPDGDKALELIEAGMLDRLSIEFQPVKDRIVDGVVHRVAARLLGVALTPEGSYAGAEVLAVREAPDPDEEEEPLVTVERLPMFDPALADGLARFVTVPTALRHQLTHLEPTADLGTASA